MELDLLVLQEFVGKEGFAMLSVVCRLRNTYTAFSLAQIRLYNSCNADPLHVVVLALSLFHIETLFCSKQFSQYVSSIT